MRKINKLSDVLNETKVEFVESLNTMHAKNMDMPCSLLENCLTDEFIMSLEMGDDCMMDDFYEDFGMKSTWLKDLNAKNPRVQSWQKYRNGLTKKDLSGMIE